MDKEARMELKQVSPYISPCKPLISSTHLCRLVWVLDFLFDGRCVLQKEVYWAVMLYSLQLAMSKCDGHPHRGSRKIMLLFLTLM